MLVRRRKGPKYYRATPEQRRYWLAGMPPRYWKNLAVRISPFNVDRLHGGNYRGLVDEQTDYLNGLLASIKERKLPSPVFGATSAPADDQAMVVAARIAKAAIAADYIAEYVDLGFTRLENVDNEEVPDVLIIHNVTAESTPARLQAARDWINWGEDCLRVVVAGGEDPVTFFDRRLRRQFDAVCYSEEMTIAKIRRT